MKRREETVTMKLSNTQKSQLQTMGETNKNIGNYEGNYKLIQNGSDEYDEVLSHMNDEDKLYFEQLDSLIEYISLDEFVHVKVQKHDLFKSKLKAGTCKTINNKAIEYEGKSLKDIMKSSELSGKFKQDACVYTALIKLLTQVYLKARKYNLKERLSNMKQSMKKIEEQMGMIENYDKFNTYEYTLSIIDELIRETKDELINVKIQLQIKEETIESQTKPKIEPKISDSELFDLESPRSEYMTELKEIVSNKFKVPNTIQEFYNILDKNGLETLEDWKKVTEEDKKLFPVGLKYFLDEKAGIQPEEVRSKKRKREEMVSGLKKKWSVNGAIYKIHNVFYTNRKNLKEKLINRIEKEGLNCILLIGPRASGKTTTVLDLRIEYDDALIIYIDFSTITNENFWNDLSVRGSRNSEKFHMDFKDTNDKKIILVLDEFDSLLDLDSKIRDEFLTNLRNLKQDALNHNLKSVIGIGVFGLLALNTENIKISPFNITDALNTEFFNQEESLDLFDQFEEEYKIKVDDLVKNEVFEYTAGHPGLFCLCGRVIQEEVVEKKIIHFTLDHWKILFSEGLIIKELKHYPTTKRILSDFKIQSGVVEESKILFNSLIFNDIETEFELDSDDKITNFLSNEGLIIVTNLAKDKFKITSPIIRDTFGVLLLKKSTFPNQYIYPNTFDLIHVLSESFKCFDFEKLKKCYEFATKNVEDQKTYSGKIALNESVYQFELGSILRSWLPAEFTIVVHAKTKESGKNVSYPDILISCSKFKIILELLSNERYSHLKKGKESSSSVLGHIERTREYAEFFKADPWVLHFVALNSIKDHDKITFPEKKKNINHLDQLNIVYLFHDHKFNSMIMKIQKKGEGAVITTLF
eukprot:gene6310-10318_t